MYVDIFGDIRESKTEDRSFLKKKKKEKERETQKREGINLKHRGEEYVLMRRSRGKTVNLETR